MKRLLLTQILQELKHLTIHVLQLNQDILNIKNQNQKIMADLTTIQTQNAALVAAVTAEDTVIDSAVVLLNGFAATLSALQKQLADAIAANDPAAIQAVADAIGVNVTDITAKTQTLATAVAANTPTA